jgi:hypothetical protein
VTTRAWGLAQGRRHVVVRRFSGADPDGNPVGSSESSFEFDGWWMPVGAEEQAIAASAGQVVTSALYFDEAQDLAIDDFVKIDATEYRVGTVAIEGMGVKRAQLRAAS